MNKTIKIRDPIYAIHAYTLGIIILFLLSGFYYNKTKEEKDWFIVNNMLKKYEIYKCVEFILQSLYKINTEHQCSIKSVTYVIFYLKYVYTKLWHEQCNLVYFGTRLII